MKMKKVEIQGLKDQDIQTIKSKILKANNEQLEAIKKWCETEIQRTDKCSCGNPLKKDGKGKGCEVCGAYYENGELQETTSPMRIIMNDKVKL